MNPRPRIHAAAPRTLSPMSRDVPLFGGRCPHGAVRLHGVIGRAPWHNGRFPSRPNVALIQAAIDNVPDLTKPANMKVIADIRNSSLKFIGGIEWHFTSHRTRGRPKCHVGHPGVRLA